jgi:putative multiple sugar transport system permease protein
MGGEHMEKTVSIDKQESSLKGLLRKEAVAGAVQKYAMFIALIFIAVLFQILTDGVLLAPINISKLVMQNSYILILAVGMLPCILTGDIDLSVGSVLAVVGSIAATLIVVNGMSVGATVAICLVFGLLVGAWQGFWIAFVRVPSFIVTLAGMLIFRGMTMVILDGNTLSPFPDSYQFIAQKFLQDIPFFAAIPFSTMIVGVLVAFLGAYMMLHNYRQKVKYGIPAGSQKMLWLRIGLLVFVTLFAAYWFTKFKGLPLILILLAALVALYSFVCNRMVIGRHIYALGGNENATRLSGIKTKWVRFLVFVNMGLMAAVAGLVFSARLNCAAPSAGVSFELDAIAACYIGGASATGGIGTIVGAVVGGLVMGTLNNGMSILGIGIDWQQMIKGLVLLAAVAFDIYNQSKK